MQLMYLFLYLLLFFLAEEMLLLMQGQGQVVVVTCVSILIDDMEMGEMLLDVCAKLIYTYGVYKLNPCFILY